MLLVKLWNISPLEWEYIDSRIHNFGVDEDWDLDSVDDNEE